MTPESKEGPPRFVLLEHRWDGVHWDFMLEREGVLKTWALATRPAPGSLLDGRRLPDHRAAYLDYEGPISGGRGSVRRVDGGTYEAIEWESDRIRVRLGEGQLVGEVLLRCLTREDSTVPDGEYWKISLGNVD